MGEIPLLEPQGNLIPLKEALGCRVLLSNGSVDINQGFVFPELLIPRISLRRNSLESMLTVLAAKSLTIQGRIEIVDSRDNENDEAAIITSEDGVAVADYSMRVYGHQRPPKYVDGSADIWPDDETWAWLLNRATTNPLLQINEDRIRESQKSKLGGLINNLKVLYANLRAGNIRIWQPLERPVVK